MPKHYPAKAHELASDDWPTVQAKSNMINETFDPEWILSEDGYHALLPSLDVVEKVRPLSSGERKGLITRIQIAIGAYRGTQIMAHEARSSTLHEIATPLAEVIDVLQREPNVYDALVALGAPVTLMLSPDQESLQRAAAEYEALLCSLRKILDKVPPPPKNPRGRPQAADLCQLVDGLAHVWEDFAHQSFTQQWHQGEPVSAAVQFVHAVIKVVDPERLASVPQLTKRVVKRRRKATSDK